MVGAICAPPCGGGRRRHGNVLSRSVAVPEDLFDLSYRLGLEEAFVLEGVEDLLAVSSRHWRGVKSCGSEAHLANHLDIRRP